MIEYLRFHALGNARTRVHHTVGSLDEFQVIRRPVQDRWATPHPATGCLDQGPSFEGSDVPQAERH